MNKCRHFEWLDDYVPRLQTKALINFNGVATEPNLVCETFAPTVGDVDLKGELKMMNKNLRQMIQLKQKANLIALGFYVCIVVVGFAYLLVISR